MERIGIRTDTIQLDQFLKLAGAVPTGGAVKQLMLENRILVNGVPETARRKKSTPIRRGSPPCQTNWTSGTSLASI